jgi:hypothetical protein
MPLEGMMDYDKMVEEFHGFNEQTAVEVLKQTVARYSEYRQRLARQLGEDTQQGRVNDAVLDHIPVNAELLSRAVG